MNKEEILKALKTIQDVCNNFSCEDCPLANRYGDCLIEKYSPIDWEIVEIKETWRAIRSPR